MYWADWGCSSLCVVYSKPGSSLYIAIFHAVLFCGCTEYACTVRYPAQTCLTSINPYCSIVNSESRVEL
jgi:hypothetical protein